MGVVDTRELCEFLTWIAAPSRTKRVPRGQKSFSRFWFFQWVCLLVLCLLCLFAVCLLDFVYEVTMNIGEKEGLA